MATTYQITLTTGTTVVVGENYNADPVQGLQILDQFGNATKTFAPGTWTNLAVIEGAPPASPSDGSDIIIDGDT